MKKRLLGIFLVVAMSASLIACGETSKENKVDVVSETETVEATPEPTVIETEEPQQEIISEEKTETVEETIVPESTDVEEAQLVEDTIESDAPTYTYTDIDATKYAKSTVNVRDLPDTSGNKVGSLSTNDEIHIDGQCNETGWYRFEYNGNVAYVSNSYLVDKKVEVSSPAETPSNGGGQSSGKHWYDGYEMYTWYDMGSYYMFIIPDNTEEASHYFNDTYYISDILKERYPDKNVTSSTGFLDRSSGGVHAIMWDTFYMKDGKPNWEKGKYLWD